MSRPIRRAPRAKSPNGAMRPEPRSRLHSPPRSTGSTCWPRISRTRRIIRRASSFSRRRRNGRRRSPSRRHHLRVPRAQRAGRALQGAGRLCHQWRQYDQARKLYGRGRIHRDAVSGRCRRPSRRAGACPRAGGAGVLLQGAENPRRLSGASVPDRDASAEWRGVAGPVSTVLAELVRQREIRDGRLSASHDSRTPH